MERNKILRDLANMSQKKEWKVLSGGDWSDTDFEEKITIVTFDGRIMTARPKFLEKRPGWKIRGKWLSCAGSKIAFWWTNLGVIEPPAVYSELYVMDVDGSNLKKICDVSVGNFISWSPTGDKIAFTKFLGHTEGTQIPRRSGSLLVIDLRTNKISTIIDSGVFDITSQAWSPDGRKIVFTTVESREGIERADEIRIIDVNQKTIKTIGTGWQATWSPDGHWIAYQRHGLGDYYIFNPKNDAQDLLIKNKASLTGALIRRRGPVVGPLIWSPDSHYLLYERTIPFIDAEGNWPHIMHLESKREVKLPTPTLSDISPAGSWGGRTQ